MENIITSIIGLIASVVMLVFSIWYIKVSLEINKARQKRIDDLKAYLDEFKTNTKSEFKKFDDYSKLPFPKEINNMLLELHTHGDSIEEEEIVYREKDVIKLLLVMQNKK